MKLVQNNLLLDEITQDQTTEFFKSLVDQQSGAVNQNELAALQSYFEKQSGDVNVAKILTISLLQSAMTQNISPMALLDEFKKLPPGEVDEYVTFYLNLNRYPTSALGINNRVDRNPYVVRRVIF